MEIHTIGIDLGKTVFHLVGVNVRGEVVARKKVSQSSLYIEPAKRTRAQRIPFRQGDRYSNKGRIHSRRPILSSSFFACKTAADHTFP